jgi:ubiquinone/menaquinone biosynthesis C-methylase UbiE
MYEVGEAYEVEMGRWSRQLAPLFVEFVGVRDGEKALDVGCGTGSLSATLAKITRASKIVGIDPSKGFIEYARTQVSDPRVSFEVGDAQALAYPDESFDRCMALLVVNFIADAPKAMNEMRRVTKSGRLVATTMWDGSRDNELNQCM